MQIFTINLLIIAQIAPFVIFYYGYYLIRGLIGYCHFASPAMVVKKYNHQGRSSSVCVIGAGVSGLRAAGILATNGFKVTILEARDRIGGRVHQDSRLGLPIDLGASWIHGTRDNPIVDLANKAKSVTVACNTVYSICDSKGLWLDRETAKRYYEEVWEILELAIEKSHANTESISDSAKLMDFFREEVQKRCSQREHGEADAVLLEQVVDMWGAFMGDDGERQSLKSIWLDAGIEGGTLSPFLHNVPS
jgi:hypothetical protein